MKFKASLPLMTCVLFGAISLGTADAAMAAPAYAPHARAAALINRDGTISKSVGVVGVAKPAVGEYCVQLDRRIDATEAIPQATLDSSASWGSEIFIYRDSSSCGDPARYVKVLTGVNGSRSDQPFFITID